MHCVAACMVFATPCLWLLLLLLLLQGALAVSASAPCCSQHSRRARLPMRCSA